MFSFLAQSYFYGIKECFNPYSLTIILYFILYLSIVGTSYKRLIIQGLVLLIIFETLHVFISSGLVMFQSKWKWSKPHVLLGVILLMVGSAGVLKTGDIGENTFLNLAKLLSTSGAYVIFLGILLIGLLIMLQLGRMGCNVAGHSIQVHVDSRITLMDGGFAPQAAYHNVFERERGDDGVVGLWQTDGDAEITLQSRAGYIERHGLEVSVVDLYLDMLALIEVDQPHSELFDQGMITVVGIALLGATQGCTLTNGNGP